MRQGFLCFCVWNISQKILKDHSSDLGLLPFKFIQKSRPCNLLTGEFKFHNFPAFEFLCEQFVDANGDHSSRLINSRIFLFLNPYLKLTPPPRLNLLPFDSYNCYYFFSLSILTSSSKHLKMDSPLDIVDFWDYFIDRLVLLLLPLLVELLSEIMDKPLCLDVDVDEL